MDKNHHASEDMTDTSNYVKCPTCQQTIATEVLLLRFIAQIVGNEKVLLKGHQILIESMKAVGLEPGAGVDEIREAFPDYDETKVMMYALFSFMLMRLDILSGSMEGSSTWLRRIEKKKPGYLKKDAVPQLDWDDVEGWPSMFHHIFKQIQQEVADCN